MRELVLNSIPLAYLGWSIGDSREKHALYFEYSLIMGPQKTHSGNIDLGEHHEQSLKRFFDWTLEYVGPPQSYEILGRTINPFYEVSGIRHSVIGRTFKIPKGIYKIDFVTVHPSEKERGPEIYLNENELPGEIRELVISIDELLWDFIRKALVQRFKLSEDTIPIHLKRHVFLAYRSTNEEGEQTAKKLGKFLKEKGMRVWYFPWKVRWADSITAREDQAIRDSFGAVICLTPDFFDGQTAKEEYRALSAKRRRDSDFRLGYLLVGCDHEVVPPFMQDYFGARIENADDPKFGLEATRIYRGLLGLPLEPSKKFEGIIESRRHERINYYTKVQAYLFFPKGTSEKDKNLEYHKENLHHRLIVNLKVNPPRAFFLTPESDGWKFIEEYPEKWVSEIVTSPNYSIDDPDFTKKWCEERGFVLKPWVAEKEDLTRKSS